MSLREKLHLPSAEGRGRFAVTAAGAAIIFGTIFIMAGNSAEKKAREERDEAMTNVTHILTDSDTRSLGLDSLAARLQSQEREIRDLKSELRKTRSEQLIVGDGDGAASQELQELRSELETLRSEIRGAKEAMERKSAAAGRDLPGAGESKEEIRASAPLPPPAAPVRPVRSSIRTASGTGTPGALRLPPGTLLSGRFITGLDAPTGDEAKRSPYPVLIELDRRAALPGQQAKDLRHCAVIAAGYGDMSSERVYLRTETLTCRVNGRYSETRLEGFITGEDGKAGVRGRLVSRQGRLIARSMTAGFLEGLGSAFESTPVVSYEVGDVSGSRVYQRALSDEALGTAALKGAGKALSSVSGFYLGLAENMFPVVEIDSGRRIDIVVTGQSALRKEERNGSRGEN